MADISQRLPLTSNIKSLLSGLRWRIRFYVWLEGLSLAAVWLLATFLVAVGIDHLPLLFGADDFPPAVRGVMLTIVSIVFVFILYRFILCRTFVRLSDDSMAVLLERRFGGFHDSLLTSVELNQRPEHASEFNTDMLNHTQQEAISGVDAVRYIGVFNYWPLAINFSVLVVISVIVGLYASFGTADFLLGSSRLYLLDSTPWPRKAKIEVVGIIIQRPTTNPKAIPTKELIPFKNRHLKVARGASITLLVHADVQAEVIPEVCTVEYQTQQGNRGKVNKDDSERISSGFQNYPFNEKPFKRILSNIEFDVIGRNPPWFVSHRSGGPADRGFGLWPVSNRVSDYVIEVVENPIIIETSLDCIFPQYMVDQQLSSWLPRTIELTTATRLPQGTNITFHLRCNKPLKQVYIYDSSTGDQLPAEIEQGTEASTFHFVVPALQESLTLEVTLHDTDGVISEKPHRIFVAAIEDQAPIIDVVMRGIGTAVTPDVRIPIKGEIDDDYSVHKSWFEIKPSSADVHQYEFPMGPAGKVEAAIDFKEIRSDEKNGYALKPKDKLLLVVKASDNYNLNNSESLIGAGDQYLLDVVTPDRLLSILAVREAELRERFQVIISELEIARDSLLRVKTYGTKDRLRVGAEPEDKQLQNNNTPTAEKAEEKARSLRVFTVQQAQLASNKSVQEIRGVALSFRDIRQELINNRVDQNDHLKRLKEDVADPLENICDQLFPEFDGLMASLEKVLQEEKRRSQAVDLAVTQADEILLELDKVLQKLLKFETYNELIEIVRSLIDDQKQLIEETSDLRKKQAFDDLQ